MTDEYTQRMLDQERKILLPVHSIFTSFDGEVSPFHQGRVSTFIRLAGCNLNCSWCDTPYARDVAAGTLQSVDSVLEQITDFSNVTLTGGEPLIHLGVKSLLIGLASKKRCSVSVETNGTVFPPLLGYSRIAYVMDYKLPSSGEEDNMNVKAFDTLQSKDIVKFVIQDHNDFEIAILIKNEFQKIKGLQAIFAFSPVLSKLSFEKLGKWILQSELRDVILSVQIHKLCGFE